MTDLQINRTILNIVFRSWRGKVLKFSLESACWNSDWHAALIITAVAQDGFNKVRYELCCAETFSMTMTASQCSDSHNANYHSGNFLTAVWAQICRADGKPPDSLGNRFTFSVSGRRKIKSRAAEHRWHSERQKHKLQ